MVQIEKIKTVVQQCHVRRIAILQIQMESRRTVPKIHLVQHLVVQITQQQITQQQIAQQQIAQQQILQIQIAQIQIQTVPSLIRVASVHTQIVQVHRRIVLILIQITHHPAQGNQALAQVVPLEVALHLRKRRK